VVANNTTSTTDAVTRSRLTTSSQPSPTSSVAKRWVTGGLIFGVALGAIGVFAKELSRRNVATPNGPSHALSVAISEPSVVSKPPLTCPEDMVLIPEGQLFIGSDAKDAMENERPVHNTKVSTFCLDRTEVTVLAYKTCSDNGQCLPAGKDVRWPRSDQFPEKDLEAYGQECNANYPEQRAQHPINCVDFAMAERYCKENNKRLPTEAEWEYATRGPDGRTYPWGDEAPTSEHLNGCGPECVEWHRTKRIRKFVPTTTLYEKSDGYATTSPVGSFPKGRSRFGADDVVGNVWEWVSDFYAPYDSSDKINPKGPSTGTERVIRGGAFNGVYASWLRPSFRYKFEPSARSWAIGFRCARELN
jgi:formylglycine-generating enzyme required for sulfatase activity